MSRTCKKIPFSAKKDLVNQTIIEILVNEGFREISRNGENLWKKGTGLATAMQYIKVEYGENQAVVCGWIQAGIGNIEGKERDLTGFFGVLPKKQLQWRLDKIEQAILSLK